MGRADRRKNSLGDHSAHWGGKHKCRWEKSDSEEDANIHFDKVTVLSGLSWPPPPPPPLVLANSAPLKTGRVSHSLIFSGWRVKRTYRVTEWMNENEWRISEIKHTHTLAHFVCKQMAPRFEADIITHLCHTAEGGEGKRFSFRRWKLEQLLLLLKHQTSICQPYKKTFEAHTKKHWHLPLQ